MRPVNVFGLFVQPLYLGFIFFGPCISGPLAGAVKNGALRLATPNIALLPCTIGLSADLSNYEAVLCDVMKNYVYLAIFWRFRQPIRGKNERAGQYLSIICLVGEAIAQGLDGSQFPDEDRGR